MLLELLGRKKTLSYLLDQARTACSGGLLLLLLGTTFSGVAQSFAPVSLYATGAGGRPVSLALGDMNGDGRVDIVATNLLSGETVMLPGQVNGFAPYVLCYSSGGGKPTGVAVSDMNKDGRPDLVVAQSFYDSVVALLGQAGGGFAGFGSPVSMRPTSIVAADLNGDGWPDSAVTTGFNTVDVLWSRAGGGFGSRSSYSTGTSTTPVCMAAGDVTGDGQVDVVVANYLTNTVGVLAGQPGGFAVVAAYPASLIGPGGSSLVSLALGDVNGDGRLDVAVVDAARNTAAVLLNQAGGGFGPASVYPTGQGSNPRSIAVGDVNGDGRLDLAVALRGNDAAAILMGQAGGGFAAATTYSVGQDSQPEYIVLGDVNGDGRLDLVTANYNTDNVGVLLNTGTFTPLAATSQTKAAGLQLYPNPARDKLTILPATGTPPDRVELLDALGQVVRRLAESTSKQLIEVETTGLRPGVYLLRVVAGTTVVTQRVAIE